jgi:hypothetical protein
MTCTQLNIYLNIRALLVLLYLFICHLFNKATNGRALVNNDSERMQKESVVVTLRHLSDHSPGGTKEYLRIGQDSRCPGRDWNSTPPQQKSEKHYRVGQLTQS